MYNHLNNNISTQSLQQEVKDFFFSFCLRIKFRCSRHSLRLSTVLHGMCIFIIMLPWKFLTTKSVFGFSLSHESIYNRYIIMFFFGFLDLSFQVCKQLPVCTCYIPQNRSLNFGLLYLYEYLQRWLTQCKMYTKICFSFPVIQFPYPI